MTRTTLPSVPELDLPPPSPRRTTTSRPLTTFFEDDTAFEHAPIELDFDVHRATGTEPVRAACAVCGAPLPMDRATCAYCTSPHAPAGAIYAPIRVASAPPLGPSSYAPPPPPFESSPVTRAGRLADAIAAIPYAFWKRIAFYPFLAMLLGNGCTCGGLSLTTNIMLGAVAAMGLLGVAVCARALQRSS